MLTSDLEAAAKAEGFSSRTLRRAKDELKQDGETAYRQKQFNGERAWYIYKAKLSVA